MNSNNLQPVYRRQRFLWAFVSQLSDGVSATDLQKLVFLYTMKGYSDFYEFIPYKYGAYSFQLAADVDVLTRDGYIIKYPHIEAVKKSDDKKMAPIANERGNVLIRKAYRQYPYYTIHSDMIDKLFYKKEADFFYEKRNQFKQKDQILFTIGYEGRSIENFINVLIKNDIRMLVDVRKNPISRKFGFSKNKLDHITGMVDIEYVHIPDLGIESEERSDLKTKEDYKKLFITYENNIVTRKESLERLYELFKTKKRIVLMCFENEVEMCHRQVIRDYLVQHYTVRSIDL